MAGKEERIAELRRRQTELAREIARSTSDAQRAKLIEEATRIKEEIRRIQTGGGRRYRGSPLWAMSRVKSLFKKDEEGIPKTKLSAKREERIEWETWIAYLLNLWKGVFLIPIVLFFWWFLFLYEFPYWIPEIGGNTIIGYLHGVSFAGLYINGFAEIFGWVFLILLFHLSYVQIYREPFQTKKYIVRLLVQSFYIGIFAAVLVIPLPNVPIYYDYLIEKGGYIGCVIGNTLAGKSTTVCRPSGERVVEQSNKIGGTIAYGMIDVDLGTKDLGYTISNPEAGKRYKLYFTVFNKMDGELEGVTMKVKAGDVEAIVIGCDYKKDETCELKKGANEFSAEFERIPETMVNFVPVIDIKYKQDVVGINKIRIIWSEDAYDLNYKPVCAQEEGKRYYCPATTKGPVDVIPSIIKKQLITEKENEFIDLTTRVWNKGTGYAYLSNAKIEQVADIGYDLSVNCQSDMFERFTLTPKGSGIKLGDGVYREYKDFYCDVIVPYKLTEAETSKEVTIKVLFDYEYIYEFKEGPVSVIV